MYSRKSATRLSWRGAWRDRRGATAIVLASMILVIMGMSGLVVDIGRLAAAQAALRANTQAAAMDGAFLWGSNIAAGGTLANAETTATAGAQAWHTTNTVPFVTITGTPVVAYSCVTATTGLLSCNATNPNVITVTQTGTVPNYFLRAFGRILGTTAFDSFTITSKAAAAPAGGASLPLNVMFVLDSTASMASSDNSGCGIPGATGTPTRYACATYGAQEVMKELVLPTNKVGLMVFPPMASSYVPCNGTYPATVTYRSTGAVYQISPATGSPYLVGGNTYVNTAVSPPALIDTSPLVKAVGDVATHLAPCIQDKGGVGTYYAEVLEKAQAALTAQGTAGVQNVIIFLSDGAANATDSGGSGKNGATACKTSGVTGAKMDPTHFYCTSYLNPFTGLTETITYGQKQCYQGVQAAMAAANAGTWVYAIAYDAPTTSDASDCPTVNITPAGNVADTYTPCTAMKAIASDATKFFSTTSTCQIDPSNPKPYSLSQIFQQVAYSLLKPRLLIPN